MWLPDDEAKKLNDLLAHREGVDTNSFVIRIKEIIQGKKSALRPEDLTWFEKSTAQVRLESGDVV